MKAKKAKKVAKRFKKLVLKEVKQHLKHGMPMMALELENLASDVHVFITDMFPEKRK